MPLRIQLSIVAIVLAVSASSFAQVNLTAEPTHGTYDLVSGFTPDPLRVQLVAGGEVNTSTLPACVAGNIPSVPQVRVNYTAGSFFLRFFVDAPGTDTTIAVHGPDGQWYCNDDYSGLNPAIDFGEPPSGQYDVFVGTYEAGDSPTVTLQVTEQLGHYGPGRLAGALVTSEESWTRREHAVSELNILAPPIYGTYDLAAGFTPDPVVIPLTAGGPVPSRQLMTLTGPCDPGYVPHTEGYR